MSYIRDGLEDNWGLKELQNKILEIMSYIDSFCMEHNIDYCLMGGSALGAVRHGGFIPWDDDLDVFMTPDNYNKFREKFNLVGDKNLFYLQEWGANQGMVTISKLRMNGTAYIEKSLKDWDIHHGIYVDIFILHTCPDSFRKQKRQYFWARYVIAKGLVHRNYKRKGFSGVVLKLLRILPRKFLIKYGLKQVYKYSDETTTNFCNFMGKATFKNAIYSRDWFVPTVYMQFENIQLKVPEKIQEFLTFRFGDYMQIPSIEKIKREQHAQEWSIKQDFRELLGREFTFKDEKKLI